MAYLTYIDMIAWNYINLACWLSFHSNQDIGEEEFEAEMGIVR